MRTFRRGLWVAMLSLFLPSLAKAEEAIAWQTDFDTARRLAAESNRLVVLHFWASYCGPCLRLEDTVFKDPNVGKLLDKHFVMVKLNADKQSNLMRQYGVKSIPTDVVVTPQGKMVSKSISPGAAQAYVSKLSSVAVAFNKRQPGMYTASTTPAVTAPRYPIEQQQAAQPPQQIAQAPEQTGQPPASSMDRYRDYYESRKANLIQTRAETPQPRFGQRLGDPRGDAAPRTGGEDPSSNKAPIAQRANEPAATNPYQNLALQGAHSQDASAQNGAKSAGHGGAAGVAATANQQVSLNQSASGAETGENLVGSRYANIQTPAPHEKPAPAGLDPASPPHVGQGGARRRRLSRRGRNCLREFRR